MSSNVQQESTDVILETVDDSSELKLKSEIELILCPRAAVKNASSPRDNDRRFSLSYLPEEILYLIFSFLNVRDLVNGLKSVCKLFDEMLDEAYFKRRTLRFFSLKETPRALKALGLDYGDFPLSWKQTCFDYECELHKWSDANFKRMVRYDFSNNTSSVDVARLLNGGRLLMTGGRDRILSLWNVEKTPMLLNFNEAVHSGWIWDIAQGFEDSVFSCDWDGKIIEWSLESCIKGPDRVFQVGRPVLSLSVSENYVVAGLQTGEICLLDPRTNTPETVLNERVQKSAVMGVKMIDSVVVSISEDKTLSVFDIKNNRQLKKCRISSNAIPVSMALINSGLYIAQTNGTITLVNTSNYKIWEVYSSDSSRLTSVSASKLGALITSSRNARVVIYSPGKFLKTIRSIELGAEAAMVDYNNGILAIARADNKSTIYNSNHYDD